MIRPLPKSVLLAAVVFLCQTPSVAQGGTLSKAEVDALWEQLLLEERYETNQRGQGGDQHVRELSMRSLKRLINQLKEEIARFESRTSVRTNGG